MTGALAGPDDQVYSAKRAHSGQEDVRNPAQPGKRDRRPRAAPLSPANVIGNPRQARRPGHPPGATIGTLAGTFGTGTGRVDREGSMRDLDAGEIAMTRAVLPPRTV